MLSPMVSFDLGSGLIIGMSREGGESSVGRWTKKKAERLHSIHKYLQVRFLTPLPTILIVYGENGRGDMPDDVMGTTSKEKQKLFITVDGTLEKSRAIEILAHEYAHAYSWQYQMVEDDRPHHSDEWGLAYAKIYRDLWEEGGLDRTYEQFKGRSGKKLDSSEGVDGYLHRIHGEPSNRDPSE